MIRENAQKKETNKVCDLTTNYIYCIFIIDLWFKIESQGRK